MKPRTYTVITGREKSWWWIEVPGVERGFSQARHYRQVESTARELISLLLDVPEDSFDLAVEVRGEEGDIANLIGTLDAAAATAKATADSARREAVSRLRKEGVPVRDVAELLHVSPAWVSELAKRV